jgi:hypothetical protein
MHCIAAATCCCAAGSSAGDSIGPVLGAVVYDRGGGLQAAFLLQTAINTAALLMALLVVPVWLWAGSSSSNSHLGPRLVKAGLQLHKSDSSDSEGTVCYFSGQLQLPVVEIVLKDAAALPAAAADEALSDTWHLGAVTDAADIAVCISCAELHSGVCQHRDSSRMHCVDSAFDVEAVHDKAAAAAVRTWDMSASSCENGRGQLKPPMHVRAAQQQQQQRLDMGSVLSTVCDWVVASQCLLVFLEQCVTSTVLVVIPVVMGTPTWLVGVVYVAMVSLVICYHMLCWMERDSLSMFACATKFLNSWTAHGM